VGERASIGGWKMTVLEKIKVLERYVSVDPSMIDSVMEMAIDKMRGEYHEQQRNS